MRSSGCGFLEEQMCHLGLDTMAGRDEGRKETGRERSRGGDERGAYKSGRGEKSAKLKGTERWRVCSFTMKRRDTNDD